MYAYKPTSGVSRPAASLTYAPRGIQSPDGFLETLIHEPLRPAKDAAIHTAFRGDSKPLPNNRTAKVLLFLLIECTGSPRKQIFMII